MKANIPKGNKLKDISVDSVFIDKEKSFQVLMEEMIANKIGNLISA